MFTFPHSRKLLISLLILSFSIFFKGCTAESKITTYQVGFPFNITHLSIDPSRNLSLQNSNLSNIILNLIAIFIILIGLVYIYQRVQSQKIKDFTVILSNMFIVHTFIHNISMLPGILFKLTENQITLLLGPLAIVNFYLVDFPIDLWGHILGFMETTQLTRLSFIINGLAASLTGVYLFLKLNTRFKSNPQVIKAQNIKYLILDYLPIYLLSGAIVVSILYLIAFLSSDKLLK